MTESAGREPQLETSGLIACATASVRRKERWKQQPSFVGHLTAGVDPAAQ
jgi:hypothetical protein